MSHDPVHIVIFVVAIGGAWLLNFAVSAIIGTLGLFIESSLQMWELWLGGFMLLSGYLIPLSLFPPWVEKTARVAAVRLSAGVSRRDADGPARSRTESLDGPRDAARLGGGAVRSCSSSCGSARLKRFAAYGG